MTSKLDINQKFAKLLIDLRKVRPFYSAVYECIDKIETETVPTAAVNGKELLYNKEFLDSLDYPEFAFVVLHELGHISLMHVSRGSGKDPNIWNVACDLVVNKLLAEEFNISPGHKNTINGVTISMPRNALYNAKLNTDKDFTEALYEQLRKQANKNGYNKNGVGKFKLPGKNGSSDSGNNGDPGNDDGEGSSGNIMDKLFGPKKDSKQSRMANGGNSVIINSQDTTDLISEGIDKNQQEYEERRVLTSAQTKLEMNSSSHEIGDAACGMQRLVAEMLKSRLDWRKLLKKYCRMARTSDTSFAMPDKRMSYQSCIYPGQAINESFELKDIKVAIDTSGSITETDLRYILGQIYDISKYFKIDAELLCWDTAIEKAYSIKDISNILKNGLAGGGGTDASCVFEYFDSKKCKKKPEVTLVFTDGYVSLSRNPKWNKKYKNTIWVMTRDYNENFKPDFGKIAVAKFD